MPTWDDVRKIASALEDVEESTSYRQPCFKTGGKTFVNLSPHEAGALVVRVPQALQQPMVKGRPELFFITPHYEGYGAVLLRLDTVKKKDLQAAVQDAYAHVRAGLKPRRSRPKGT